MLNSNVSNEETWIMISLSTLLKINLEKSYEAIETAAERAKT